MSSVIYKISSKAKDNFYIGSAINYDRRIYDHMYSLTKGNHPNRFLQRHVDKYGIEDLEHSVLEEVKNPSELIGREQYYIDTLNPHFNMCRMAGSRLGTKHSPEVIEKLKISHKNMSDETRKKIGEGGKGRIPWNKGKKGVQKAWNKGKVFSEETREKQRISALNRKPASEEARKNMSKARKKLMLDPKEREKASISMKKYKAQEKEKKQNKSKKK